MAENYEALVPIFTGMGVLDDVDDLRRPGVTEPFSSALRRCMSANIAKGGTATDGAADSPSTAVVGDAGRRRRLVQDADGADRRRAFGQLYEELSELAFQYYFTIPSYYILVMRAFVTLEGIALSADDGEFNMYRGARWRTNEQRPQICESHTWPWL